MERDEALDVLGESVTAMRAALQDGGRDAAWLTATALAVQQARQLVAESTRKPEKNDKQPKANGGRPPIDL